MKKISVGRGKYAIIDDRDFKLISQFKWHIEENKRFPDLQYASMSTYDGKMVSSIKMHRLIMGRKNKRWIDHRDGNGLNNRRSNLRFCSISQNHANRRMSSTNKSGFKGVCFLKKENKWFAQIRKNNKNKSLGLFRNKIDAARCYDKNAVKLFGEFARTNEMMGLYARSA